MALRVSPQLGCQSRAAVRVLPFRAQRVVVKAAAQPPAQKTSNVALAGAAAAVLLLVHCKRLLASVPHATHAGLLELLCVSLTTPIQAHKSTNTLLYTDPRPLSR